MIILYSNKGCKKKPDIFFFGYCEQTKHRTTEFGHSMESLGCKLSIVGRISFVAFVSKDISQFK